MSSNNLAEAAAHGPTLNELCQGIFNVPQTWHSLNTEPQFPISSEGQTDCEFVKLN
jgi:hypothetical protein